MTDPKRAFVMFSGGLDSILAARHLTELGIEVIALHFQLPFLGDPASDEPLLPADSEPARRARQIGVALEVQPLGPGFIEIIRKPRHGHGKGINPCVDCKTYMISRARELMPAHGVSFVATGEVLGQRPMSQRRDTLRIIERDSGLEGYLLRPLTARNLEPTVPEERGWVDRERLLDFKGRSRKPQFELAAHYGIKDPPGSGGGCLLTDQNYARRLRSRFERGDTVGRVEMHLLKFGRHFRTADQSLVIVSRNDRENDALDRLARLLGLSLLEPEGWPGPLAVLEGQPTAAALTLAGRAAARYGKPLPGDVPLMLEAPAGSEPRRITVDGPATDAQLDEVRL